MKNLSLTSYIFKNVKGNLKLSLKFKKIGSWSANKITGESQQWRTPIPKEEEMYGQREAPCPDPGLRRLREGGGALRRGDRAASARLATGAAGEAA